jgi:membrane associated rhomboid family serine protease
MSAPAETQPTTCYRHPKVETKVACSNCGRPICTDCMVFAPVGIKCPECAGQPTGVKKATTRARRAAGAGTGAVVTKTLIGLNAAVFLLQAAQGDLSRLQSDLFVKGALYGPAVADGDWWRLVTAGFLHASIVHIGFNMLMLWWFGAPLEALLGRGRFLAVYGIAIVAGSAGALVLSSDVRTLGASGGVFGILGAGIVLERRGIPVFGGAALPIALVNLLLGFVIGNVSIGGHLGGLIGGMLAIVALGGFRGGHAAYTKIGPAQVAGLAGIVVVSLVVSYMAVAQYM